MSKRQSGYYTLPIISSENGDFIPKRSSSNKPVYSPMIKELTNTIVNTPSGNWSDAAWVTEFINTANIDGTTAMSGSEARLSLQETIDAYEAVPASKLSKTEKQALENAKSTMAGINENAVYIQYGGKGDMQEMKIGNAGIVVNSIRTAFGSEAEQKGVDFTYSEAVNKRIKEFTKEAYLNSMNVPATEFNLNSGVYEEMYQIALKKLKDSYTRFK